MNGCNFRVMPSWIWGGMYVGDSSGLSRVDCLLSTSGMNVRQLVPPSCRYFLSTVRFISVRIFLWCWHLAMDEISTRITKLIGEGQEVRKCVAGDLAQSGETGQPCGLPR